MTAIAERKYEALLNRFTAVQASVDGANLKRYHQMGGIFNEFCEESQRQTYGERTVQRLADDLRARGTLTDIMDPVRYLYWAKSLYDFDPTYVSLADLSSRGFTMTHAKLVFSLKDELRAKILAALMSSDKVPSTRDLETQLRLEHTAAASQAALDIAATSEAPVVPDTPILPPGPAPVPAPTAAAGDKPEKASKPEKTTKAKESDTPANALKTLNQLEKTVSRMIVGIPDALLILMDVDKRGFDSDKASKNYNKLASNLRAAVNSAIEPLNELKKILDEQASSSE